MDKASTHAETLWDIHMTVLRKYAPRHNNQDGSNVDEEEDECGRTPTRTASHRTKAKGQQ